MMADIISDALSITTRYAGWSWANSTATTPGYDTMLVSTRLSFAAATLGFIERPDPPSLNPDGPPAGTAHQIIEKVVVRANWALYLTVALASVQAALGIAHLWLLLQAKWIVHFGILQVMEMQAAASRAMATVQTTDDPAAPQIPSNDGVALRGHCSGYQTGSTGNGEVVIRGRAARDGHLRLVRLEDTIVNHPNGRWAFPAGGGNKFR